MNDAIWALIGVMIGTIGSGVINFLLQCGQHKQEIKMYKLQNQSSENAKSIIESMLNHRSFIDRSFESLKRPIGGFSDDEIRRLLLEVNAKRVFRDDGSEWWYLLERQDERIQKRTGTGIEVESPEAPKPAAGGA
jgi:hypothetical protein